MTLGRYVRQQDTSREYGPQTLLDASRFLKRNREDLAQRTNPKALAQLSSQKERDEELALIDQMQALITTLSTKLRLASVSTSPQRALQITNEKFQEAGFDEMSFEDFWEAYEVAYEEYEGMITEIVRRSGNADLIAKYEHILMLIDDLAEAVVAYDEKQRPLDDITLPTKKDKRRGRIDWTTMLV